MWQQTYAPIAGSLPLSAVIAAAPIAVLLLLLAVAKRPAWLASLAGLATAAIVASAAYGMPADRLFASITYGAAFGLFPIGWVVFTAILLYRITVESGKFEILKNSIASLTSDQRLQALLIAFAFGAFIEGAAGFGTPVAVAGAMLAGLGFTPFYAAAICLLANTAPVAFGSIAIPITTLALTTGLPVDRLSAGVGRICAPVSLFVPAYLILVMSGWKGLRAVFPAAAVCGVAFAGTQFFISNFVGPQLTDILASMAAMGALVALIRVWRPEAASHNARPAREIVMAWTPYILLVIFVLTWGELQAQLNKTNIAIAWPMLHNTILRMPPAVAAPAPYAAVYTFGWLSASGTACLIAAIFSAVAVGLKPRQFVNVVGATARQLGKAELTLAAVLGLAFLMNYSGSTATLGLAFAATGAMFPFFSALLGWLGVFLTGSDTSANALFGTLQVVTAHK
ncbi:MAG TPA: lactate permease LctP family transporter, partial [Bryobacteraceae bacterium]|nr:lactate permease LctP family transporter [Bryobacteraceae bacterium]